MLVRTLKSRVVEGERVKDVESEQICVRNSKLVLMLWCGLSTAGSVAR
jgi:hypothetical protein